MSQDGQFFFNMQFRVSLSLVYATIDPPNNNQHFNGQGQSQNKKGSKCAIACQYSMCNKSCWRHKYDFLDYYNTQSQLQCMGAEKRI